MGGLISAKADKLRKILDAAAVANKKDKVVHLSDAFFAYSNDVVRDFCFGSDNNLLEDLPEAKKQRESLARLLTGVPLNKHFPWIGKVIAKGLPMVLGKKAIPPAVSFIHTTRLPMLHPFRLVLRVLKPHCSKRRKIKSASIRLRAQRSVEDNLRTKCHQVRDVH